MQNNFNEFETIRMIVNSTPHYITGERMKELYEMVKHFNQQSIENLEIGAEIDFYTYNFTIDDDNYLSYISLLYNAGNNKETEKIAEEVNSKGYAEVREDNENCYYYLGNNKAY